MKKIIGVRFRTAGKIYYFDPLEFQVKRGDHVIVETARGIEYGTVVGDPREVEEAEIVSTLKPVLRIASQRDMDQEAENKRKEKEAFKICHEKIKEHGLDMKLIDAEYTFDNNKVLFYFTADGRIDFRDLVKDLASVFRTRIELRQIGVRDETKIRGGIGMCGRPLCCHSYLSDFIPVSIKMAKEQSLSLNPTKISGMCGRLMCCLKNEQDTYEELNRKLPSVGDGVICPGGLRGEVSSVNVLRQTVKVVVEEGGDKEVREFAAEEIHFHHHKNSKVEITEEGLQAVRDLEEKNDVESLEPEEQTLRPERREKTYRERGRENRGRDNRSREKYEARENRKAGTEEVRSRRSRPETAEGKAAKDAHMEEAGKATGKERSGSGGKERSEGTRGNDRPGKGVRTYQNRSAARDGDSAGKTAKQGTQGEKPQTQKATAEKNGCSETGSGQACGKSL